MLDPEERLIEEISSGRDVSLERSLLFISGLTAEDAVSEYRGRLDKIHDRFLEKLASRYPTGPPPAREYTVVTRARLLFEHLWNEKPRRCDGNVLLTDVIDAQTSADPGQPVGSCVGLTSLYTVLGVREGLHLGILSSGSHVLNRLNAGEGVYNIENTDPLGFDCSLIDESFVEYPAIMIVAHVLNGRGRERERANELAGAAKDYTKAICLNPAYAVGYNNRGAIRLLRKDYAAALADYDRAIEINPRMVEAHFNHGLARIHSGSYREAAEDFERVLAIDPECEEAHICLAFARGRGKGPARLAGEELRPLRPEHEDGAQ
jgi:tetratricopeptide (TPR) repeat protein